jgi:hypothetical protein
MKKNTLGFVLILLVLIIGCSGTKLAMDEAMVDPPIVNAGDQALIIVKITDKEKVVNKVTATVREYPEIVLDLSDAGENGDEVSGDGTWSY